MVARRLLPEDYARCSVTLARYACRDQDQRTGRWLGDAGFSPTTVGGAGLFQHLRGQVPSGAYRNGVTVHGLADDDDAGCVTLKTSAGIPGPFDLIAFADGYRFLGREIVALGAELRYRGLVFWRGLISEADADIDRLDGAVTRVIYTGGHGPAATVEEEVSVWSRQQEKTIQAIEPVAERNGKNLISEIPDLASLSPEDAYSWLSAIHPGAHITLPRTG